MQFLTNVLKRFLHETYPKPKKNIYEILTGKMVIFKINHAGIAQTHLENDDATNSPHVLLAVTKNLSVVYTNNYKPIRSSYTAETGHLHTTNEFI